MFKSYKFNQPFRKIAKKGVYDAEKDLLHEFFASKNNNVMIEYDLKKQAVNASVALKKYIAEVKMPVEIFQREKYLFVVKKGEKK